MSRNFDLIAESREPPVLSMAPAVHVALGEIAHELTVAGLDVICDLSAEPVDTPDPLPNPPPSGGRAGWGFGDTLTLSAGAEFRVNWGNLQQWLERS